MRRRGREAVEQLQNRLLHRPQVLPLLPDLGDHVVSPLEEILDQLLLAPEKFLSPDFFFLPFDLSLHSFGLSLGAVCSHLLTVCSHFLTVCSHLLKQGIAFREQLIVLLVPLRGIGLSCFPPRRRCFLASHSLLLLRPRFP